MPVENSYIDTFYVKNKTKRTITLGDLVNVSIGPNKTEDLLSKPRVTKEKINQSKNLQEALKANLLQLMPNTHNNINENKVIIPVYNDIENNGNTSPVPGSIIRTNGKISSILKGDITWTINRDINNKISSMSNGEHTYTFSRDINGKIQSWSVN
jgi:hypothetical protein